MHIVAPMVAHMRIEVLSLLAYRTPNLILIWDTGTSYGLTPFRSDFIDYVNVGGNARANPDARFVR